MLNILNKNSKTTNKRMRDFLLKNTMEHIRKITNDYKNKNRYKTEDIINKIEHKMEDKMEHRIEDINKLKTLLLFWIK